MDMGISKISIPSLICDHFPNLRELSLTGNSLSDIPQLPPSVEILSVCLNSFIEFPKKVPESLLHLGLAYNKLQTLPVESASSFSSLLSLDVSYNEISDLRAFTSSVKLCPCLKQLSLMHNPVCLLSGYRPYVVSTLPNLIVLDEHHIDATEQAASSASALGDIVVKSEVEMVEWEAHQEGEQFAMPLATRTLFFIQQKFGSMNTKSEPLTNIFPCWVIGSRTPLSMSPSPGLANQLRSGIEFELWLAEYEDDIPLQGHKASQSQASMARSTSKKRPQLAQSAPHFNSSRKEKDRPKLASDQQEGTESTGSARSTVAQIPPVQARLSEIIQNFLGTGKSSATYTCLAKTSANLSALFDQDKLTFEIPFVLCQTENQPLVKAPILRGSVTVQV